MSDEEDKAKLEELLLVALARAASGEQWGPVFQAMTRETLDAVLSEQDTKQ